MRLWAVAIYPKPIPEAAKAFFRHKAQSVDTAATLYSIKFHCKITKQTQTNAHTQTCVCVYICMYIYMFNTYLSTCIHTSIYVCLLSYIARISRRSLSESFAIEEAGDKQRDSACNACIARGNKLRIQGRGPKT